MFKMDKLRAGKMAQEVKMLAANPNELNLISEIYMLTCKFLSDFCLHSVACTMVFSHE